LSGPNGSRLQPDISDVLPYCFTTFPLRLSAEGPPEVGGMISNLQEINKYTGRRREIGLGNQNMTESGETRSSVTQYGNFKPPKFRVHRFEESGVAGQNYFQASQTSEIRP
jgi:hypothetical protein